MFFRICGVYNEGSFDPSCAYLYLSFIRNISVSTLQWFSVGKKVYNIDRLEKKMNFDTLLYDIEDNILTITLNRPDKLNAFNFQMQNDLIKAFDEADKDDNVKAIIVTGAGRGFCAGADLSAGARTFDFERRDDRSDKQGAVLENGEIDWSSPSIRDGGGLVTLRIFDCLKPVISACNGPAVGVGVTMQLAMDIRLASEEARYGFVFARRGLVPEACSSWFLPKIVGISQALEWVYSGKVFLLKKP